jgi:hypothetical protein
MNTLIKPDLTSDDFFLDRYSNYKVLLDESPFFELKSMVGHVSSLPVTMTWRKHFAIH